MRLNFIPEIMAEKSYIYQYM